MRLDLSVLNDAQRAAVVAPPGPLLVLAGAGSGKTRVITYRIAQRILDGTPADRICGITFTNKAAAEMRERLLRMYPDLDPLPSLSTFHALGLRILREEHHRLGFRSRFPIYDDGDARSVLVQELRTFVGLEQAEKNEDVVKRRISRWKSAFIAPEVALETAEDDTDYLHARIYAKYQKRLELLNAVDFDDLIYQPVRLIESDAECREKWGARFECVLVDEYQDSNTAQFQFARLLAGNSEDLTVVGDDDQSIYAFRGAEVEKILRFRQDFPRADVVTLDMNYRSVKSVLDAANAVIANNTRRHEKSMRSSRGDGKPIEFIECEDEIAEAEVIVGRILDAKRHGLDYADQAILLRSAIQSRPIEEKLRFFEIPYKIVGARSFFDRKEVRDVLAYLRALVDPDDDIAVLRILNVPKRGWGATSRERLDEQARARGLKIVEAIDIAGDLDGISLAARQGGRNLLNAFAEARELLPAGRGAAIRTLIDRVDYRSEVRDLAKDALELENRTRAIDAILESIEKFEEKYGPGRLVEYLRATALDGKDDGDEAERDQLTILTFHGSKGLEYRRVILAGVEDELIPHRRALAEGGDAALEEERRLFYVAMTRARDELIFTRARERRKFGRTTETSESRFVVEIPEELIQHRTGESEDEEIIDVEDASARFSELRSKLRDRA